MRIKSSCLALSVVACAPLAAATLAAAQVRVVNMIPRELSGEFEHNSEPYLAVNPTNPKQIITSAHYWDANAYCDSLLGLLLFSADGGDTWQHICALEKAGASSYPGDITLAFSSLGNRYYAAYLSPMAGSSFADMKLSRGVWTSSAPTATWSFYPRSAVDQPQIVATTTASQADRLYVGFVNKDPGIPIEIGPANVAIATSMFPFVWVSNTAEIDVRGKVWTPSVRVAVMPDKTVLAAFYRYRASVACTGGGATCRVFDIIATRTSSPAGTSFDLLKETEFSGGACNSRQDALGVHAVDCANVLFDPVRTADFGYQPFAASHLSVAADPSFPSPYRVYLAYGEGVDRANYKLKIIRSEDGGETWPTVIREVPKAVNPTLTVTQDGTLAFLYQQFVVSCGETYWETRIELTRDGFATPPISFVLARTSPEVPNLTRASAFLGDYIGIQSAGSEIFGVFTASNKPQRANFPRGVIFNRNADWTFGGEKLLNEDGVTPVTESLDPYFFSIDIDHAFFCDAWLRRITGTLPALPLPQRLFMVCINQQNVRTIAVDIPFIDPRRRMFASLACT